MRQGKTVIGEPCMCVHGRERERERERERDSLLHFLTCSSRLITSNTVVFCTRDVCKKRKEKSAIAKSFSSLALITTLFFYAQEDER